MVSEQEAFRARRQAFLERKENARLRLPSKLAIDLRSRVAGECRPYQFGGVTHYLDDRSYLIIKRLLARFDDQYTIGVYELLLKALKRLSEAPALPDIIAELPFLSPGQEPVQFLNIGWFLQRKGTRLLYTADIEIRNDDIFYQAKSIDISPDALRVVMKRAFTLTRDQIIHLSFIDLSESISLREIPHRILHIEHDERRSHLILKRQADHREAELAQWFSQWIAKEMKTGDLDVEDRLQNIISQHYLRLFHRAMKKPLIWFADFEDERPIRALHINPGAESTIQVFINQEEHLDLSLLPISALTSGEQNRYLISVHQQHDKVTTHIADCNNPSELRTALAAQHQQVFLIESHSLDSEQAYIVESTSAESSSEEPPLSDVKYLFVLTNITPSCQSIVIDNENVTEQEGIVQTETHSFLAHQPEPMSLDHRLLKRDHERFLIRTDIAFCFDDLKLTTKTHEVSEMGLSVHIPEHLTLNLGARVTISFLSWQKQTKKVKLHDISYIVRRIHYWEGETHLGLERLVRACGEKQNQFFSKVIEDNRAQLALDESNLVESRKAKFFSQHLASTLPDSPFYLGLDENKQRIIQAVANTQRNKSKQMKSFWLTFNEFAADLVDKLTLTQEEATVTTLSFGVFGYISAGTWHIATDFELTTVEQKRRYLQRALISEQSAFFHCDLTDIKDYSFKAHVDLNEQLGELRQHSRHRVKQVQDGNNRLLAIGNLTDISEIIRATYAE